MERKNTIWMERFRAGDFSRVLYAEANEAYFDLVVLEKEKDGIPSYSAIPAPVLYEMVVGELTTNTNGDEVRWAVQEFLGDFDVISRDRYYGLREIRDILIADRELSLSNEDRELLQNIRHNGLVLDKIENQFGETIVAEEILFHNGIYYHRTLDCYSSSWLGLGTCQCASHDYYEETPISAREALEMATKIIPA